jgi:dUTP pyrophosphatase
MFDFYDIVYPLSLVHLYTFVIFILIISTIHQKNIKTLKIKRFKEDAKLPTYGSNRAAGLDLYSCADIVISARGLAIIPTGIGCEPPPGCYCRLASRSSLARDKKIEVKAGVIDEDYQGQILVILENGGDADFAVKKDDRIAQMIVERYEHVKIMEIHEFKKRTDRGNGGFGSTGFR